MNTRNLSIRFAAPFLVLGALGARADAGVAPPSLNIVETAQAAGNFTTLVAALQATGLDAALSGTDRLTVFAPTDAAFAALPPGTVSDLLLPQNLPTLSSILLYHVVDGGKFASTVLASPYLATLNGQRLDVSLAGGIPRVEDAVITVTDIRCSNGIIHVIDAVMIPNLQTIPQVAAAAGGFETLLTAVGAAGLAGALSDPGPFTVFAPTNAAFATVPVNRLLLPVNLDRLQRILAYHVVPGRIYADQLVDGQLLTTALGQTLRVTRVGNDVFVDGVRIEAADIEAGNGNIHVLGGVLIPVL